MPAPNPADGFADVRVPVKVVLTGAVVRMEELAGLEPGAIVRLHLRAPRGLPDTIAIPSALSVQRNGSSATVVVRDWSDGLHSETAGKLGVEIEVEQLTLEDIFLELHR